jgi:hypothetical protein
MSSIRNRYIGVHSNDEQRGILSDAIQATVRSILLSDSIPPMTRRVHCSSGDHMLRG